MVLIMKSILSKKYLFGYLISITLAITVLSPAPAQAAVATFNCPGGGTYSVNNGILQNMYSGNCVGAVVLDSSVTQIDYATGIPSTVTSIEIPATTSTIDTINGEPLNGAGITAINVNPLNENYKSVDGVLYTFDGTVLIQYPYGKTGDTFVVPAGVTTISSNAFACATNLHTVTIPSGVTTADYIDRINGCNGNGISEYIVSPNNAYYSSVNGVLFNKTATTILAYPVNKTASSYVMPSTVTTISYNALAYSNNHLLQSITLSPNLISINTYAFTSLELPTLNLPASLTTMNNLSLDGVLAITVDSGSTHLIVEDGVLYNFNKTKLVYYPRGITRKTYTLPSTVTEFETHGISQTAYALEQLVIGSSLTSVGGYNGISNLKYLSVIGDSTFNFENLYLSSLISVNYCGSNATTIANIDAKLSTWNNATRVCVTNPAFTISKVTETVKVDTAITGYTITSTGGTITSYSISPSISNTPGLSFSTSTGLISGTPTTIAAARTYTITANNIGGTYVRTFSLTVEDAIPAIPFLKAVTLPQIHVTAGKLLCTAGTYQSGNTKAGVVQSSSITSLTPANYVFNLLVDGVTQSSLAQKITSNSAQWALLTTPKLSTASCSVTVVANAVSTTDSSTENVSGFSQEKSVHTQVLKSSSAAYKAALTANTKAYLTSIKENRATWIKRMDGVRYNYYVTIARIQEDAGSKMVTDTATALKILIDTHAKLTSDYLDSKPAARAVRDQANKAALEAKNLAITKSYSAYGSFIESIGYGVLIQG